MKYNSTEQLRSALINIIPNEELKNASVKIAKATNEAQPLLDHDLVVKNRINEVARPKEMKLDRKSDRLYVYFENSILAAVSRRQLSRAEPLLITRQVSRASFAIDNVSKAKLSANPVSVKAKSTSEDVKGVVDAKQPTSVEVDARNIFDDITAAPVAKKTRVDLLKHLDELEGKVPHATLIALKKTALETMPPSSWTSGGLEITVARESGVKVDLDNVYETVNAFRVGGDLAPIKVGKDLLIRFGGQGQTRAKAHLKASLWVFVDLNDANKLYAIIRTEAGIHEHFSITCN